MTTISNLPKAIVDLSRLQREVFESIFSVESETTRVVIPDNLKEKVKGWYAVPGDSSPTQALERAEKQIVVRVLNKVTHEQTLFNSVRSMKPAPTVCKRFRTLC
eukprot:4500389-Pyramimonas_sp.AAC.3